MADCIINRVSYVSDAKIIPFSIDSKLPYDQYIHGIAHKDLRDDLSGLLRGEKKILLVNSERRKEFLDKTEFPLFLSGISLYVGPFYNHFGHFVSQTISRLWGYAVCKNHVDNVIFLGRGDRDNRHSLKPYMVDILGLFGIPLEKVVFVNTPAIAETLIVPEQGYGIDFKEEWYKDNYPKFVKQHMMHGAATAKKVFLSRRKYENSGRLAGMNFIGEILTKDGYKEVFPEELTLRKQMETIQNADYIVAEEGSAMHILDIMPSINANIFLIGRRRENTTFLKLARSVTSGDVYHFKDVYLLENQRSSANCLSVSFQIDQLIRQLHRAGFTTTDIFCIDDLHKSVVEDINRIVFR